ncbi:DUF5403 family protein [Curtobacterium sp. Curtsp57]|uniref:DUF5403 family protein n=1 Tax=Curtobacterium sp. Curtsp57 TaxID=3243047 RepID=UPI0039B6B1C2
MAQIDRNLSTDVAKMVGSDPELQAIAEAIATDARANYAGHGDAAAFVHVEEETYKGVREPRVVFDHPVASFLEFGHMAVNPKTSEPTGRWVPGIHGLQNAARQHGSGRQT